MKKSKHNISFFLTNPDFVKLVNKPSARLKQQWEVWLKENPQDKETFYRAKIIIQRINFRDNISKSNRKDEILQNILNEQKTGNSAIFLSNRERGFQKPFYRAIAAALILLLASTSFILFFNKPVEGLAGNSKFTELTIHASPLGERTIHYLPDSSKVILNSGSSISYSEDFNQESRDVLLSGQAYFDVSHDKEKKFRVKTDDFFTSVHGTSFSVNAYTGYKPSVALKEGRVSVYPKVKDTQPIFLNQGDHLLISEEDFSLSEKTKFHYLSEFGWTEGVLFFENSDFEEFVRRLETWYGIKVNVIGTKADEWRVNGSFKNETLENVLKSTAFARGISYSIKERNVTIYIH